MDLEGGLKHYLRICKSQSTTDKHDEEYVH